MTETEGLFYRGLFFGLLLAVPVWGVAVVWWLLCQPLAWWLLS